MIPPWIAPWITPWCAVLAVAALVSALLGMAFAVALWLVRWDVRLVLVLLLLGLLGLGYETVALGLADGLVRVAAITASVGLPGTAMLGLARLARMPPDLLRVAAVSGLAPVTRCRVIVLPLVVPSFVAGAAFAALAGLIDAELGLAALLAPALGILIAASAVLSRRPA